MEENIKINNLVTHIKEYAEERLNLIVLNLQDKVSGILSNAVSAVLISLVSIFTLLFLSLGLAWWIGQQLEYAYLGFLIVGGLYLAICILIYVNRERWIQTPIINSFLKHVTDEKD